MATTDTLLYHLLLVLSINAMLMMGQAAIIDTNPTANQFFDCKTSILASADDKQCTSTTYTINTSNIEGRLPGLTSRVSNDQSSIWTDIFDSVKTWLLDQTGLGYVLKLLGAPYTILSYMNLEPIFVFAIGSLWYLYTLFIIVAFMWGR